jgi:hypothetical protein
MQKHDEVMRKLSQQVEQTRMLIEAFPIRQQHAQEGNRDSRLARGFDETLSQDESEQSEWINMRASCYRKTCLPWCSCQCHIRYNLRTPDLFKSVMGSLFVGYSSLPVLAQNCNEKSCRRRSALRVIISYQFPKWMWARALLASMLAAIQGPELLLRVPRIIPFASHTYQYCLDGSVMALRRLFEEGHASPYDIDARGFSLLHVSSHSPYIQTLLLYV